MPPVKSCGRTSWRVKSKIRSDWRSTENKWWRLYRLSCGCGPTGIPKWSWKLRHYSEKYADYKVYSEYAGVLAEDKDELLGRLTAWNHHIIQGVGSTFLIISVWEPGKDPKSAYRYYLVKE